MKERMSKQMFSLLNWKGSKNMVDEWTGRWIPEKDYSQYPKEKWCDMDYMANWIFSTGYEVKTTLENLINHVLYWYEYGLQEHEDGCYYSIKDERDYPENDMVNPEDVAEFVRDMGGLEEFDYEI